MKTILRTKLTERNDKKYIELRDYEIKSAIEQKQSIKVEHEDELMILTWRELKKGKIINTQKSKFPPFGNYLMLEYPWNPHKDLDEQPQINYDTKLKLSKMWKETLDKQSKVV